MTQQRHHKWRHVKNTKITKNRQNQGFSLFFQAKVAFLAMMRVKVCLHMFLLQINQLNKIKHSKSVFWKQKHDLCVISIENQFLVRFSLNPLLYYERRVITLGPCFFFFFFFQMALNRAQGLKEKSYEVSGWKNSNQLRYNKKKCRGGRILPPPALLGVRCIDDVQQT